MGAWGLGPFENDSACDWLMEAEEEPLESIRAAFAGVAAAGDYLDSDQGAPAVAAAYVVATLVGRALLPLPEELSSWVSAQAPRNDPELVASAVQAVKRVLAANSELKELWEETEDGPAWSRSLQDLLLRLEGAP